MNGIRRNQLVLVLMLALATVTAACGSAPGEGAAVPEATSPATETGAAIVADARVVPVRYATLSLSLSGSVSEVLVAEGEQVQAGQILLRLDAARPRAEVAQAEAALGRAQARLDGLKAGPRAEEVAVAEAAVAVARAALQKLQQGADESLVVAGRAEVANAEAALQQAQAAYDRVAWDPGIAGRPESLRLQQATNTLVAAKGRLDALLKGPRPGDVAVAEAEIRRALAQLDLVKAGARPEDVAAAQADLAAAQASLDQARAALAQAELRAPFAGTVAALDVRPGELLLPGQPVVQLGDLTAWRIETEDVTDLDVAGIHEGDAVSVTFDAIPGLELGGKVARIRQYGEKRQGDIVYTVVVEPVRQDPRLRWNMTAAVAIP